MKKLIALGISIAILISAFVLLPKQKNEDVIAYAGDKKNEKIESIEEFKNALMSISGLGSGVKSGKITYSFTQDITSNDFSDAMEDYMFEIGEGSYDYYRNGKIVTIGGISSADKIGDIYDYGVSMDPTYGFDTGIVYDTNYEIDTDYAIDVEDTVIAVPDSDYGYGDEETKVESGINTYPIYDTSADYKPGYDYDGYDSDYGYGDVDTKVEIGTSTYPIYDTSADYNPGYDYDGYDSDYGYGETEADSESYYTDESDGFIIGSGTDGFFTVIVPGNNGVIDGIPGYDYDTYPEYDYEIDTDDYPDLDLDLDVDVEDVFTSMLDGIIRRETNVTMYFDDGVTYYQVSGYYVSRNGSGDNKEVLTYVYDMEIYVDTTDDEDVKIVRFNFFDGYSNDSKKAPVISIDKLDVWYNMDQTAWLCVNSLFAEYTDALYTIDSLTARDFEKSVEDVYVMNSYMDDLSVNMTMDLSKATEPTWKMFVDSNGGNILNGQTQSIRQDVALTMSNINNINIKFDLDDVDVKKTKSFDWDFFEELLVIDMDEEGGSW